MLIVHNCKTLRRRAPLAPDGGWRCVRFEALMHVIGTAIPSAFWVDLEAMMALRTATREVSALSANQQSALHQHRYTFHGA
jgi:hypothetical protein